MLLPPRRRGTRHPDPEISNRTHLELPSSPPIGILPMERDAIHDSTIPTVASQEPAVTARAQATAARAADITSTTNTNEEEAPQMGAAPKPALPTKAGAPADDAELLRGIRRGAQVWTTYVKEAKAYDEDQVDGWNRSLDVTLVFAALFSAILTAFVLESIKSLQPDPSQITAETLGEISQILRGMAAGQPLVIESPSSSNTTGFQPTPNAIYVNILWFLSLSLSVAVSLGAMLAKQWCYYFLSRRTGDAIAQARERQQRFNGIQTWRMGGILEMLPVLMHVSLAVFSIGLVLFLWDINIAVATTVTVVVAVTTCFYVGTTFLPVVVEFCPFKTPQAEYITSMTKGVCRIASGRSTWIVQLDIPALIRNMRSGSRSRWSSLTTSPPLLTSLRNSAAGFTSMRRDPHSLDNRSAPIRSIDGLPETSAPVTETHRQPRASSNDGLIPTGPADPSSGDGDKHPDPIVKDSLLWLIKYSQSSNSVDTAIGALAIGKVYTKSTVIDKEDLKRRIQPHLVKQFADCFKSHKERGVKISLLDNRVHLASALDYSRWMTEFAGSKIEDIVTQIPELSRADVLGINLVTHLGLAFASLGESKALLANDSKNIAMWLSAFVKCYETGTIYLSEQVVSAMIDGLTAVSLRIPVGNNSARHRANSLALPQLIQILWTVSHIKDSQLRTSIGLNLTVFALKSQLLYPFDPKNFDTTAERLVNDYQNGKLSLTGDGFAPLAVFSFIGFLHPKNDLGLDGHTSVTIARLIVETGFFDHAQSMTTSIPNFLRFVNPESFRRTMTRMLIETMIPTTSVYASPVHGTSHLSFSLNPSEHLQLAFMGELFKNGLVFQSILHAVCKLIHEDISGGIALHPENFAATTDLLFQEVKQLDGLDPSILRENATRIEEGLLPPNFGWPKDTRGWMTLNGTDNTPRPASGKFIASSTLALIMSKSKNKQCIEIAVRAVLHHSSYCKVDLVIDAITWFADRFSLSQLPQKQLEKVQEDSAQRLLSMSGYARILVAMVMHCDSLDNLVDRLKAQLRSDESSQSGWISRLGIVKASISRLAEAKEDDHIHAFGIAGLAVWNLQVACPVEGKNASAYISPDQLKTSWDLIAKYSTSDLRPEALEALLDSTVLLAAFTEPALKITPENTQLILGMLAKFYSESEPHVRPALAVAVTFWGLSYGEDEVEWPFWTYGERQKYWKRYSILRARTNDMAALFLLGLSKILVHYSRLLLSHTSIKTIANEINRYMKMHTSSKTLTLEFLSKRFDVRREVRKSVREYLQKTEKDAPFTKSDNEARAQLLSAITLDGGEGYGYEMPQPFTFKNRAASSTEMSLNSGDRPVASKFTTLAESAHDRGSLVSDASLGTSLLPDTSAD